MLAARNSMLDRSYYGHVKVHLFICLAGLLYLMSGHAAAQNSDGTAVVCRTCHAGRFASLARSPHSVIDSAAWQEHRDAGLSCTACHGDVTEHISAGGRGPVFAFSGEAPLRQTEVCNACHADTHPQYAASPHARAGLTCTACHRLHDGDASSAALLKNPVRTPRDMRLQSAVCAACHQATFAEFERNERHRLEAIDCTSCHDPHAPQSRTLLGGFKQQACVSCHPDKEGPFVFEHQASRVEGCTACHSPHGSPNRHLLTHQRTGELCFTCHAAVPQFHSGFAPAGPPRFGLDTQCTNCHVAIHGSNLDPGLLR
jgi:DmsE family decaheme c-type cytochrome